MTLCDIGNTTFHFKIPKKEFKLSIDSSLKNISIDGKLYFISVNDKATKKLLKQFPNAINIKKLITFQTTYQGMGIDRKVVCSCIKNGIVVDMGSAITVDIVQNNLHLGGFILPGIKAYQKIYPNISPKLQFDLDTKIDLDTIPQNTHQAINYSVLQSIVLPIKNICNKYNLPIYFTGGDMKVLESYFKTFDIKYKKNMIFKSMKKIIKRKKDVDNSTSKR